MSDNEKLQRKCDELAPDLDLYTPTELYNIYHSEAHGAPWSQFERCMRRIDRAGLDVFRDQAYIVRKEDKDDGTVSVEFRSSIQALRMRANETGEYAGQEGPFWTGDGKNWVDVWLDEDELPAAAKVTVYREGFQKGLTAVAKFEEYAARYSRSGDLMNMWAEMPAHMIGKCAEALAIKKAFPQSAGGILTRAEMHRDDDEQAVSRKTRRSDGDEEPSKEDKATDQLLGTGDASGDGAPSGNGAPSSEDASKADPTEQPLDPSAVRSEDGEGRTSGSTMSDSEQAEAQEATQQRAETNGAPEATISEGQERRLWAIAKDEEEGQAYSEEALRAMIQSEFGYQVYGEGREQSISDIRREDYDQIIEACRDAGLASRYRAPGTADMFEEADLHWTEALVDELADEYDLTDAESERIAGAVRKATDTLSDLAALPNRVKQGAAWLAGAEDETEPRRRAIESVCKHFDVAPIPQDFPHRSRLTSASLYTLQQVHDNIRTNALTSISGIGENREAEIVQAIGHYDFKLLPVEESAEMAGTEPNDPAFAEGVEDEEVPI